MLAAAPPDKLGGDARRAQEEWLAAGGSAHPFAADALSGSDVIVDGLLGIGLAGAPRAETLAVIRAINAARRPVLALDIPSGVDADSGAVHEAAVRAELTVSFVGAQVRAVPRRGPGARRASCCSTISAWWRRSLPQFAPLMRRIDESELAASLPRRARESHKGSHGRVLVVGGGAGMPGALRLAGEAALRVGAGLVTVAGAPENLVRGDGHAARAHLSTRSAACRTSTTRCAPATCSPSVPGSARGDWARRLWAQVLRGRRRRRSSMPTR